MKSEVIPKFIFRQARRAVARIVTEYVGDSDPGSGFFVSEDGHLLTAYHVVADSLGVRPPTPDRPAVFPIRIAFDAGEADDAPGIAAPRTVTATCRAGWQSLDEDWVLLQLDHRPSAFLPLRAVTGVEPGDPLVTYGFAQAAENHLAIGGNKGEFRGFHKHRGWFDTSYMIRGRGQSGSPVYHLRTHSVIGVASHMHAESALRETGICAGIATLLNTCPDLAALFEEHAHAWDRALTAYIAEEEPGFPSLDPVPALPRTYLPRPGRMVEYERALRDSGAVLLHGQAGAGKTTCLADLARRFQDRRAGEGAGRGVFWFDFDTASRTTASALILEFALFLARSYRDYGPLEECLEPTFQSGDESLLETLPHEVAKALARARCLVCLDNLHIPQRARNAGLLRCLTVLIREAMQGEARFLLASWDPPELPGVGVRVVAVRGFDDAELRGYLDLYDEPRLADPKVEAVCRGVAQNIVVLDQLIRLVNEGAVPTSFLDHPPAELRRHLREKYTKHLTDAEKDLLLTFAVFHEPISEETAEAVSRVGETFRDTFDTLLRAPPLIEERGEGLFEIHSIVRSAVLNATSGERRRERHRMAAERLEARKEYFRSAWHFRSAGRYGQSLDVLSGHVELILGHGEHNALVRLLEEVREEVADDRELIAKSLIVEAGCETIRGEYADAIRHYRVALGLIGDERLKLAIVNRVGNCYRLSSEYGQARDAYQSVIASADATTPARVEYADALLGRAKIERLACRYAEALSDYARALEQYEIINQRRGIIEAKFGFGEIYRLQHRLDASLKAYGESLQESLGPQKNLERQAYALWGIGEVLRLERRFEEAAERHEQGLVLCTQVCDRRSEGWAHLGLAEVARAQREDDLAARRFAQALRCFEATGSLTEVAHARLGMAELERTRGGVPHAHYEAAEAIYRPRSLHHSLTLLLIARSMALLAEDGREDSVHDLLAEASRLCVECRLEPELGLVRSLQGRARGSDVPFPEFPLNFP